MRASEHECSCNGVGCRWWHRYALSLSFISRLMYFKYTVGECVTNRIVCVQHEQVFNIQMSERQRRTKSVTAQNAPSSNRIKIVPSTKKCTDFFFLFSFIIRFVHFESHRLGPWCSLEWMMPFQRIANAFVRTYLLLDRRVRWWVVSPIPPDEWIRMDGT